MKFFRFIYRIVPLFFWPFAAFADDGSGDDRVSTILGTLIQFTSGVWGASICSLAITGMGFACFVKGAVPVSRVLAVTLGSACVVGAPRLIHLFGMGT